MIPLCKACLNNYKIPSPTQTTSPNFSPILHYVQERPQYLHHFVLHAALDAVDEAEWASTTMHLGVVDRFNSLQVSAFTTAGRVRFLLLHDGRGDESIKSFFKSVYELYLKAALSPFFIPTAKIASPEFSQKVKQLARLYFR